MGTEDYLDVEWARQMIDARKAEQKEKKGDDIRWGQLPDEGGMLVRILPFGYTGKKIGQTLYKHYNLPEGSENTCMLTWQMECPVCNVVRNYANMIKTDVWEKVGRAFFNALVLAVYDKDKKIIQNPYNPELATLLRTPYYTLEWLLIKMLDPNFGNIIDVHTGHDFEFMRKTKSGAFNREIMLKPRPIADNEEKIQFIVNSCYDLPKIWKEPDTNFIAGVRKAAMALEILIKGKIQSLAGTSTTPPPPIGDTTKAPWEGAASGVPGTPGVAGTEGVVPGNGKTVATPDPVVTTAAMKPPKAPECFGVSFIATEEKCQICPYDYLCTEAMKKSA